ncbi:MAG: hypothetical protein CMJ19_01345 [Phycisphaeraceae bacterium]|nr:hypothetical protein [Phycisphaeraceae bacterium]
MNLNQREKWILITTLTVLGIFLLDRLVISRVLDYRDSLVSDVQSLSDDLSRDIHLIKQGKQQQKRWKDMMAIGLPNSASEAESRTLEAINQWASETKVDLLSVKPEYRRSDESLVPVVFRVTANGSMKAIAKFIWKVETADIPVCVDTLQINARDKKNKDELSMQMGVSALYRKSVSKEVSR